MARTFFDAIHDHDVLHGHGALVIDPARSTEAAERMAFYFNHPLRVALRGFIDGLPEEWVYRMIAVMYVGRDGDDFVVKYRDMWSTFHTRVLATQQMLEKRPLPEYLETGLDVVEHAQGYDVDVIPLRLGDGDTVFRFGPQDVRHQRARVSALRSVADAKTATKRQRQLLHQAEEQLDYVLSRQRRSAS